MVGRWTGSDYAGGWLETFIKDCEGEVHQLKSEYIEAQSIYAQNLQDPSQDPINRAWALVSIAQVDLMTGADRQTPGTCSRI
jgi:hypothetical protein